MQQYVNIVMAFVVFCCQLTSGVYGQPDMAEVKVSCTSARNDDTLILMYYDNRLYNVPGQQGNYKEIEAVKDRDGLFVFKFPVSKDNGYFFIAKKRNSIDSVFQQNPSIRFRQLTIMLFPEAGDDILVEVSDRIADIGGAYRCTYSGDGSEKYNLREQVLYDIGNVKNGDREMFNPVNEYGGSKSLSERIETRLAFLEQRRFTLSRFAYDLLKADIIFENIGLDGIVEWYYERKPAQMQPDSAALMKLNFQKGYKWLRKVGNYGIGEDALVTSVRHTNYIIQQTVCDNVVYRGNVDSVYYDLKNNFTGGVRDHLITSYYLKNTNGSTLKFLPDALAIVRTPYCASRLQKIADTFLQSNKMNFSLTDVNGKTVKLNDFSGKTIFIDFWFTPCGACADFYASTLSKVEKYFKDSAGIVFLTISVDRNFDLWKKSLDRGIYTSPAAVNLFTSGEGSGHKIIAHYNISGYPSALLIAPDNSIYKHYGDTIGNVGAKVLIGNILAASRRRKNL